MLFFHTSKQCCHRYKFLTTDKEKEIINDIGSQYILIDLLDRCSLEYPSIAVIECVILYTTFVKIANSTILCKNFYVGPCRSKLIRISMTIIEKKHVGQWRESCECKVWRLDILHKLLMTVSNCILSKKVKMYNALIQKCDNRKVKKYSN